MAQKFSWNKLATPFFSLAPMAGISNQPFRLICKSFGVDVLFSEMISSEAIWHAKKAKSNLLKTLELIRFSQKERPFIVQIFGSDPEHMAFAAKYIGSGEWAKDYQQITNDKSQITNKFQSQNSNDRNSLKFDICNLEFTSIPEGIDVNMGCPARDITKTGAGAALIKNPKLASRIIKAVKKSIKIPLSVKTRLGWNDDKNILTFLRMLECCGADAITIHGRTVAQGFTGPADWQKIGEIEKMLKIPVIGNGGIDENFKISDLNFKLDGYMIGRRARGNPWLFENIKLQMSNVKNISLRERKKIILAHAKLVYELQGERGIVEFRKHLAWYFSGVANSAKIRAQLVKVNSLEDINEILSVPVP